MQNKMFQQHPWLLPTRGQEYPSRGNNPNVSRHSEMSPGWQSRVRATKAASREGTALAGLQIRENFWSERQAEQRSSVRAGMMQVGWEVCGHMEDM